MLMSMIERDTIFASGESMWHQMLEDLRKAEKFILLGVLYHRRRLDVEQHFRDFGRKGCSRSRSSFL